LATDAIFRILIKGGVREKDFKILSIILISFVFWEDIEDGRIKK
jgi:hypothetical protein